MSKERKGLKIATMVALMIFAATPAFARSISLKDAGIALWVFIIIGAIIVLLQLIPAAILFFSFIGTSSAMVFKGKKREEEAEETGLTPETVSATAEK
jgi:hypothetical protein